MNSNVDVGAIVSYLSGPSSPYPNGILPVKAKGIKSEHNGQEIPYLTRCISNLTLTYQLNLPDIVSSNAGTVAPLLGPLMQFVL